MDHRQRRSQFVRDVGEELSFHLQAFVTALRRLIFGLVPFENLFLKREICCLQVASAFSNPDFKCFVEAFHLGDLLVQLLVQDSNSCDNVYTLDGGAGQFRLAHPESLVHDPQDLLRLRWLTDNLGHTASPSKSLRFALKISRTVKNNWSLRWQLQ